MPWQVPAPYASAIRNSLSWYYTVDATLAGTPVASDLRPTGGSITDTTKPGVRRTLSLELAAEPGLYNTLSATGTTLTVTCRVTYTDQSTVSIPMGVFDVDAASVDEGGGKISLTCPDLWGRIQRARFVGPSASIPGWTVARQLQELIQGAIGYDKQVNILTSNAAVMGSQVWDKDRAQAAIDLANGAGLWVYFDRNGVPTVADIPTVSSTADWLLDASASGVLITSQRQTSRSGMSNVVVIESSASPAAFATTRVWDNDPSSPTYAGTDPYLHPETAGPAGISTFYFDTPLPLAPDQVHATAMSILSKTVGRASSVSLTSVPNMAINAFDVIDVLSPQERYDIPRSLQRHIVDTVVHPLVLDSQGQQITGRSTRTDAYT